MNLLPCKICGGKVDFCEWCGGCHLIVCSDCKASFNLIESIPNDIPSEHEETMEDIRLAIAEFWNSKPSAANHAKECGHECYECQLNGIAQGDE